MFLPLTVAVLGAATAVAAWAAWFAVRDRAVVLRQLVAGAAVEALLVVQVLVGAADAVSAPRPGALWWGYALGLLALLPLAAAWAFAERTRWSSVVLLVAALAVVVMQLRLVSVDGGWR